MNIYKAYLKNGEIQAQILVYIENGCIYEWITGLLITQLNPANQFALQEKKYNRGLTTENKDTTLFIEKDENGNLIEASEKEIEIYKSSNKGYGNITEEEKIKRMRCSVIKTLINLRAKNVYEVSTFYIDSKRTVLKEGCSIDKDGSIIENLQALKDFNKGLTIIVIEDNRIFREIITWQTITCIGEKQSEGDSGAVFITLDNEPNEALNPNHIKSVRPNCTKITNPDYIDDCEGYHLLETTKNELQELFQNGNEYYQETINRKRY